MISVHLYKMSIGHILNLSNVTKCTCDGCYKFQCDPFQTFTFLQNNVPQVILRSILILFYLCFKYIVNPSHVKYPKTACHYILSIC